MSDMEDRVLALAGVLQALAQVRRIAETGQSETAQARVAMDSVFRIDAATTQAVYGDAGAVNAGLRLLRNYLANNERDETLAKLGLSVLQLERRFQGDAGIVRKVQTGIGALSVPSERLGSTHPDVIAGLGSLYADTVSTLRPRVMVQGNPHYLAQPAVVAEIRAILLSAVRSAVLWRQLGGSYWDFLLARKAMLEAAEEWLARS